MAQELPGQVVVGVGLKDFTREIRHRLGVVVSV